MITLTPNAAEVVRSNINREKLSVDTALRAGASRTTAARIAATQYSLWWWNSIRMLFVPDDHLFERRRRKFGSESTARAWLIWMGLQLGVPARAPKEVEFMFLILVRKHIAVGCGKHVLGRKRRTHQEKVVEAIKWS